ncbi:MAG TPA: porin [Caldimonas sp.]|nr:porin [Caldimonas sp.]
MKKSLLALAVLGAYAGVASAQSSVTLYGTLDVAGKYVKTDGQDRRLSESTDGINSSQLGFRGVEDLGGGLKAGFTLLAGLNVNNGDSNVSTPSGSTLHSQFFNRRSTVSLFGNWGEVRLGRDYTPDFWSQTIYDAFGTNGLGSSLNVRQLYAGTRRDNSIGYFLPSNLGGFYGQAMTASAYGTNNGGGGQTPTLDKFGRYFGLRGGFAAGPFDVALAYGNQRRNDVIQNGSTRTQDTWNIGGSWDFGVAKVMGYYDHEKVDTSPSDTKEDVWHISGVIPFGQSEVHVGYTHSKLTPAAGSDTSIDQFAGTYQYNLSKRTAVYATASRLSNKDKTTVALPGSAGPASVSGKSSGAEFGLRHFF